MGGFIVAQGRGEYRLQYIIILTIVRQKGTLIFGVSARLPKSAFASVKAAIAIETIVLEITHSSSQIESNFHIWFNTGYLTLYARQ